MDTLYITFHNNDIQTADLLLRHLQETPQWKIVMSNANEQTVPFDYQKVRLLIMDSDVCVALISTSFVQRAAHLYELAQAVDQGKVLILLRLNDVIIPTPFDHLHFIDFEIGSPDLLFDIQKQVEYHSCSYENKTTKNNAAMKRFIWTFEEEQNKSKHESTGDELSNLAKTELQLKDIQSTLVTLCGGINRIEAHTMSRKKRIHKKKFPPDIRKVARRYQDVMAYAFLRQFGRLLDLEESDLDEIEEYSGHSAKEAFWHTIRIWLENAESTHMTVGNLITALKECGVDLNGKQMPVSDKNILRSKMGILAENVSPLEPLIPHLCTQNLICEVTKAYILTPKTSDQRINRLVDVLMTKENGLDGLCVVLNATGYDFISQSIQDSKAESLSVVQKPIAVLKPSMRSSESTTDSDVSSTHIRQIINDYNLSRSRSSSASSVFTRRGSTTSLKVASVSPSMKKNDVFFSENELNSDKTNVKPKHKKRKKKKRKAFDKCAVS